MKIKINALQNKIDIIFLFMYECIVLRYFMQYTFLFPNIQRNFISVFIIAFLLLILLNSDLNRSLLIFASILSVMILLITFYAKDSTFIYFLFIFLTVKFIQHPEFCIKIDCIFRSVLTVLTVIFAEFGLITNKIVKGSYYSYGFAHVNRLGAMILIIAIELFILAYISEKVTWKTLAVSVALFILVSIIRSKTSAILILILMFVEIGIWLNRKYSLMKLSRRTWLRIIAFVSFSPLILTLFFMMYCDGNNIIILKINQAFNQRLLLLHRFASNYSITLFGQQIKTVTYEQSVATGATYSMLDNAYAYLLIKFGFIMAVAFFGLFLYATLYYFRKNRFDIVCGIALMSWFAFFENQLIDSGFLFLFIYAGIAFWNQNSFELKKRNESAGIHKKIAFEPFQHNANPYIKLVQRCILDCSEQIELIPLSQAWSNNCCAVILNWYENLPLTNSLYWMIKRCLHIFLLQARGKKIIFVMHNRVAHNGNIWSKLIAKYLLLTADAVQIHSELTRNVIAQQIKTKHKRLISYIPHPNYIGVYPDNRVSYTKDKLGIPKQSMVYLFIGLVKPYKNIEIIINAAKDMEDDDAVFLIAGQADDAQYVDMLNQIVANRKNIKTLFRFIPDEEIVSLLNLSDVVILPYNTTSSLNSGTVYMAFSYGKTVICPMIGTLQDIHDNSLYFGYTYKTIEEHQRKFNFTVKNFYDKYYNDRDSLQNINNQIKAYVMQFHSHEAIVKNYKQMFKDLNII